MRSDQLLGLGVRRFRQQRGRGNHRNFRFRPVPQEQPNAGEIRECPDRQFAESLELPLVVRVAPPGWFKVLFNDLEFDERTRHLAGPNERDIRAARILLRIFGRHGYARASRKDRQQVGDKLLERRG